MLLPRNLTGNVTSASIYSSLPATAENLIEKGRFAGDTHNGGRSHFRFGKSGSSYPSNSVIVAELRNGQQVTFQIKNSGSRNT